MKKISHFLVIALVAALIVAGLSVAYKGKEIHPKSTWYFLPWAGEWIDLNFLTFSAQNKQSKHLTLASKRLNEYFAFNLSDADCVLQNQRYVGELSRAYYMAEQLALIDPELRDQLAQVYVFTFNHLGRLDNIEGKNTPLFIGSAKTYNARAIKTLLQKYQYNVNDTQTYKELIELLRDRLEGQREMLTADQKQKLDQANQVLAEGRELEWAYDILIDI